jgi:hypothetical protein
MSRVIYKKYVRKPDRIGYARVVHVKCVDGKFYAARPFCSYILEKYESWINVAKFLDPNFICVKIKMEETKPLTELEWLDKVQKNFKELDNDF